MWTSLVEGLRHAWNDLPLRTVALLLAGLGLIFRGPFMVGVPAFANAHLAEGAAAFGIIISALGVGSIIGALIAGMTKPEQRPEVIRMFRPTGATLAFLALAAGAPAPAPEHAPAG